MSRDVTERCDSCGVTRQEHDSYAPDTDTTTPETAWWDWQCSTTDVPSGKRGWKFLSRSWDLCDDCSRKAFDAIVAVIGRPSHDSLAYDLDLADEA